MPILMVLLQFKNISFLPPVRPNLVPKLKCASIFMKIDTVNNGVSNNANEMWKFQLLATPRLNFVPKINFTSVVMKTDTMNN